MTVEEVIRKLTRGGYDPRLKLDSKPKVKLSNAQYFCETIIKDYVAGEKTEVIRQKYHITSRSLYGLLEDRGVPRRSSGVKMQAVAAAYASGMKIDDIKKTFNVTSGQITYARRQYQAVRP